MAFPEFSSSRKRKDVETGILGFWKEKRVFEAQVKATAGGKNFVFFEGPPTANGKPGIHHVLSRVFKDIYIRYAGQRGFHVPRQAGWDCHGLPVEREVEKKLGITAKAEIEEKVGLAKFNELCRESVLTYIKDWNDFSERLGFWIDLKQAYYTMDNSYIEGVWGLLKNLWDKGLIEKSYKVVPVDPVMGSTLSAAEVSEDCYKMVDDPSLTVRFKVADGEFAGSSILVWTTTPWTLPSNVSLAVSPADEYVHLEVQREDDSRENVILAAALQETVFASAGVKSFRELSRFKGSKLQGFAYERLFDWVAVEPGKKGFYVVAAEFVTMDTGTGIVHLAPAYGADDLEAGQKYDLPILHGVGLDGNFAHGPLKGTFFKDADKEIIRLLKERGQVWKSERYRHTYPFGWRTGAPLMYYAKDAWYIRTTRMREKLVKNNSGIRWVPEHVKQGRFGNWLENNRDWALSRERYWGTPLPVWTDGEEYRIIGSVRELEELCGKKLTKLDLHKPHIDNITFTVKGGAGKKSPASSSRAAAGKAARTKSVASKSAEKTGQEDRVFRRVPEVIDCWFDSGAMPYAQWGFPVRGSKEFQKYFPADFICEAVDQTRGWFYTLLAISTMVSNKASYKNVVCLGHVLDARGEKMSKSKGNTVDPWQVFEMHGADAIRWHFLVGAPPGNSRKMGKPGTDQDPVADVFGFLNMMLNSAGFFALYANVDGIQIKDWEKEPVAGALPFKKRPEIDRWILSRLQQLVQECTEALDDYDCQRAGRAIERFTEDLSNWYIRRNRRRFWKGEKDPEKLTGYDTLYRCLVTVARLMAPFAPFLAEEIYQGLVRSQDKKAPISVNLAGWPRAEMKQWYDSEILASGDLVLSAASLGRAARAQSGMKIRQPLARIRIFAGTPEARSAIEKNQDVLKDELNVKEVEFLTDAQGLIDYRVKPNLPRLGKRLGAHMKTIQDFFKSADAGDLARRARAGETTIVSAGVELEPEDVLVEPVSAEGTAGVEGSGLTLVLDTALTPELIEEGMIRDLVRNLQDLRKKTGLEVTDRIVLEIESDAATSQSVQKYRAYIEEETLARLSSGKGKPAGAADFEIEGRKLSVRLFQG